MDEAWAGIDAGKEFHWAHVLDAAGRELLSRKLENNEADISEFIEEVLSLAEEAVWAVDQPGGGATLLLALLWERDQRVLYIPGLSVDRARDTYRGESKTDARDARIIADQARMRSDLGKLRAGEEEITQLRLLLGRRRDLHRSEQDHHSPQRGPSVAVSGPGASVGSEQEGSPYPPHPLPETGAA